MPIEEMKQRMKLQHSYKYLSMKQRLSTQLVTKQRAVKFQHSNKTQPGMSLGSVGFLHMGYRKVKFRFHYNSPRIMCGPWQIPKTKARRQMVE